MQRGMMYGILFRFSGTPDPINTCSRAALNHTHTRHRYPPPITDVPARGDARFMRRPRSIHSIKRSLADVLLVNGSSVLCEPFYHPPPSSPQPTTNRGGGNTINSSYNSRSRMCVNKRVVYL